LKNGFVVLPHPGLLPKEKEQRLSRLWKYERPERPSRHAIKIKIENHDEKSIENIFENWTAGGNLGGDWL
jgi:hypothetical protein